MQMDFVFSDVESGDGTYDTRGGFDYHLPVEGSAVKEPSLYVAHISVEMAPIAKVGRASEIPPFTQPLPYNHTHILSLSLSLSLPPLSLLSIPHRFALQVGGLGDVVVALGRAVKEQGHHVEVILPK